MRQYLSSICHCVRLKGAWQSSDFSGLIRRSDVLLAMTALWLMASNIAFAQEFDQEIFCQKMQVYKEQEADYVPGVDVHGNAVTPADLNAPALTSIHDPVVIPIEIDLATRFGLSLPSGVEMKPEISRMEIYQDGRIVYNGQDMTKRVQEYCNSKGKDELQSRQGNGQEQANDVPSATEKMQDDKDVIMGSDPENTSVLPSYNK